MARSKTTTTTKPNEPKETKVRSEYTFVYSRITQEEKRQRIANTKKAQEVAFKYILPGIGATLAFIVVVFFYFLGFGKKTGVKEA